MSDHPFASGGHGTITTGELVVRLDAAGHDTGIGQDRLAEALRLAREVLASFPAGSLDSAGR